MMSNLETVSATLNIEMNVDCPECGTYIDIMDDSQTNGDQHDDDGYLFRQMFPSSDNEDFECENVVCTDCKTEFNVKGLAS